MSDEKQDAVIDAKEEVVETEEALARESADKAEADRIAAEEARAELEKAAR